MLLNSREQLGGSALIERGQLVNNRLVEGTLAGYVQMRVRRGLLPPFSGAKHSPHLCAASFGYIGNIGSNTIYVLKQSEPQFSQITATVISITQGKYVFPWCVLPPPTLHKWAGKRLSPEVRKTVWFITLVVGGTGETVGPRETSILSICYRPVPDAGYQTRCAICLFLNGISYVPNTKQTVYL